MFVGYHVATAYYVESRLSFRDVKPHVALYVWIPAVTLTAPPWPAALIAAAELQIRGKHQVLPLSRHSEDGPAGAGERRHLHGPPVLYYTPQVGKGRSPTMQGIRRSRW